jgi:hypothetical protein
LGAGRRNATPVAFSQPLQCPPVFSFLSRDDASASAQNFAVGGTEHAGWLGSGTVAAGVSGPGRKGGTVGSERAGGEARAGGNRHGQLPGGCRSRSIKPKRTAQGPTGVIKEEDERRIPSAAAALRLPRPQTSPPVSAKISSFSCASPRPVRCLACFGESEVSWFAAIRRAGFDQAESSSCWVFFACLLGRGRCPVPARLRVSLDYFLGREMYSGFVWRGSRALVVHGVVALALLLLIFLSFR